MMACNLIGRMVLLFLATIDTIQSAVKDCDKCFEKAFLYQLELKYCEVMQMKNPYINGLFKLPRSIKVHYMQAFESMYEEYWNNKDTVEPFCRAHYTTVPYKKSVKNECKSYSEPELDKIYNTTRAYIARMGPDYSPTIKWYVCLRTFFGRWVRRNVRKVMVRYRMQECTHEYKVPKQELIPGLCNTMVKDYYNKLYK